jgi:hypothetical protein
MTLMKLKLLVRHIGVKYILALSAASLVAAEGQTRLSQVDIAMSQKVTVTKYKVTTLLL